MVSYSGARDPGVTFARLAREQDSDVVCQGNWNVSRLAGQYWLNLDASHRAVRVGWLNVRLISYIHTSRSWNHQSMPALRESLHVLVLGAG